jgi:hypothetical protein
MCVCMYVSGREQTNTMSSRLRASSSQYMQLQSIVQKLFDVPPSEHVVGMYSCAKLSGIGLAPRMVRNDDVNRFESLHE